MGKKAVRRLSSTRSNRGGSVVARASGSAYGGTAYGQVQNTLSAKFHGSIVHLPVDLDSSSDTDLLSFWALIMAAITAITLIALLLIGVDAPSPALPIEPLKATEKDGYDKIQRSLTDIQQKIKQLKK